MGLRVSFCSDRQWVLIPAACINNRKLGGEKLPLTATLKSIDDVRQLLIARGGVWADDGSTSANGSKPNALHASTCTTSIPSF